jgi:hypothetical protein
MRYLHHQARWQELKRSHRVVILWAATARKIPNAVQGSVGRVETTPIAIIPDIGRRFPPPWTVEGMTAERPMTAEQAATLKRLAEAAYELETFQLNLTRAEADLRIATLTAKPR